MRATGANARMARAQGVHRPRHAGRHGLSNALVAWPARCSRRPRAARTSPWASAPSSSAWPP
jgi:hypothetical protein